MTLIAIQLVIDAGGWTDFLTGDFTLNLFLLPLGEGIGERIENVLTSSCVNRRHGVGAELPRTGTAL